MKNQSPWTFMFVFSYHKNLVAGRGCCCLGTQWSSCYCRTRIHQSITTGPGGKVQDHHQCFPAGETNFINNKKCGQKRIKMASCKNEHNKSQVALIESLFYKKHKGKTHFNSFYSNICWANTPLVVITQSCQWYAEKNLKKKNIMETCDAYCLVLSFSLFLFLFVE